MSYKTEIQNNNVDLQSILDSINSLPDAPDIATIEEIKTYLDI